jgi:hypothetical protein
MIIIRVGPLSVATVAGMLDVVIGLIAGAPVSRLRSRRLDDRPGRRWQAFSTRQPTNGMQRSRGSL